MTADPQDLLRLADEVAANSGSDNLDGRIAMAMGWQPPMLPGICGPNYSGRSRFEWHDQNGQTRGFHPPRFTASLDAAMTLAPDGWYLRVEPRFYSEEGQVRWRAHAIRPDWSRWSPYDDWFDTIENIDADRPSLALCAAALRARAHSTKETSIG